MRKNVSLALIVVFLTVLSVIVRGEIGFPTIPERPLFKNSNIFMKNQLITSYSTFGKTSYFQNTWLGSFSCKMSPLTTMTFNMSVNKLDGSMKLGSMGQPFSMYSIQMDQKRKGYSCGIRFGNTGTSSYYMDGPPSFLVTKSPVGINGYVTKTFMEGTFSLSLYGSTILSR